MVNDLIVPFRTINDLMVLNAKKCHYICFGTSSENDDFILDGIKLPNSCKEKILGVIIDNELKFDPYIGSMCKKAAQKLGVLNRIFSLLEPDKKRLVFNAVIKSHFNYCPLMWMFSSRKSDNLINRIHERSLRTVYNDTSSTFQELLKRNRSVSIHHKNIQILNYILNILQSWRHFLISAKTDTALENFKKLDSKK